jgi:hypothetical protein
MTKTTRFAIVCAALAALCLSGTAVAQDAAGLDNYIKMLRKDIKTVKKELINESGAVPADKADAFWKVYNEYQAEANKLTDDQLANLKSYAINYGGMTDDKAESLTMTAIKLRKDRLALLEKYYAKFKKVLGPIDAAKVVQCEMSVAAMIDGQLAAELPLIHPPKERATPLPAVEPPKK